MGGNIPDGNFLGAGGNFPRNTSFVVELLGFVFYIYTPYFYALLKKFIKTEQTIGKLPHFHQIL